MTASTPARSGPAVTTKGLTKHYGALIEAPTFYPTLSGVRNLEVLTRLGRIDRALMSRPTAS